MIQGAWLTTDGDLLCTDTYDANAAQSPYGMLRAEMRMPPCNSTYYIFERTRMVTTRDIDTLGCPVTSYHYVTELHYCDAEAPGPSFPVPHVVTEWVKKNIKKLCGGNAAHAAKWKKWMGV